MDKMRCVAVAAAVLLASLLAASAETVKLDAGSISGVNDRGVGVFRGVPYAAPPVGNLRWRAPRPVPSWEGVRPATEFGPDCIQPTPRAGRNPGFRQDEDCLTLNIWTTTLADDVQQPVMVWIHGGGNIIGGGAWPFYDGTEFAKSGVVLVTINYRLGRFGTFAHPALSAARRQNDALANYGLMDQIAALEWVQRNIAAFGGDPDTVTIFGESAGATNVNFLMIAPPAKGLFHRAISESTNIAMARLRKLDQRRGLQLSLEAVGVEFAKANGIESSDGALAALRQMPASKVYGEWLELLRKAQPVIDGTIVPDDVGKLFYSGKQHNVPYMAGGNSYEGSVAAALGAGNRLVMAALGADVEEARSIYGKDLDDTMFALLNFGDATFLAPGRYAAAGMATVSAPAYHYYFGYVAESVRDSRPGANHGGEVPFVFKTLSVLPMISDTDRAFADSVHRYWVSFARTGDPNHEGAPKWPAYETATDSSLVFGNDGIEARHHVLKERLDFHLRRFQRK